MDRQITNSTTCIKAIFHEYAGKNSSLNPETAAEQIVCHQDLLTEKNSLQSWFSGLFRSKQDERLNRAKRQTVLGCVSQEMELFKRSAKRALVYTELTGYIQRVGEENLNWPLFRERLEGLTEEIVQSFQAQTKLEEKRKVKPYLDACHISLATIAEIEKGDLEAPFSQVKLQEEIFRVYAEKKGIYLHEPQSLEKSFSVHLEKIKEYIEYREVQHPVESDLQRVSNLKIALKEKTLGRGAIFHKKNWKNILYAGEIWETTRQFQVKIPSTCRSINTPITAEERLVPFSSLHAAGFSGNTFCSSREEESTVEDGFVLDATYLVVNSSGVTLAGGDGYEHPSSLKRREQISRVAYFGNKHLVRLANTFPTADELYHNLLGLFQEAAREARIKSNSDEGASSTVIRTFVHDKEAEVVVGSVGDALAFAYEPISKEVTFLAKPRRYPKGFGGFAPKSFTDAELRVDHVEQVIKKVPLGAFVFYMTDGVWINLHSSWEKEGHGRVWNIEEESLKALLGKVEPGVASADAYQCIFSNHCIAQVEAKRQEFAENLSASDRPRILGDDATLVIFKVEHN